MSDKVDNRFPNSIIVVQLADEYLVRMIGPESPPSNSYYQLYAVLKPCNKWRYHDNAMRDARELARIHSLPVMMCTSFSTLTLRDIARWAKLEKMNVPFCKVMLLEDQALYFARLSRMQESDSPA
jgi:hypothetical protein